MFNFMYIFEISYLEFIKKTSVSKKHTLMMREEPEERWVRISRDLLRSAHKNLTKHFRSYEETECHSSPLLVHIAKWSGHAGRQP